MNDFAAVIVWLLVLGVIVFLAIWANPIYREALKNWLKNTDE